MKIENGVMSRQICTQTQFYENQESSNLAWLSGKREGRDASIELKAKTQRSSEKRTQPLPSEVGGWGWKMGAV